jgi:hypothetical protein
MKCNLLILMETDEKFGLHMGYPEWRFVAPMGSVVQWSLRTDDHLPCHGHHWTLGKSWFDTENSLTVSTSTRGRSGCPGLPGRSEHIAVQARRAVGGRHVSQTIRIPNIHLARKCRIITCTRVICAWDLSPGRDMLCSEVVPVAVEWRLMRPLTTPEQAWQRRRQIDGMVCRYVKPKRNQRATIVDEGGTNVI